MLQLTFIIVFFLAFSACKPASFHSVNDSDLSQQDTDGGEPAATADIQSAGAENRSSAIDEQIIATEIFATDDKLSLPEPIKSPAADLQLACAAALKDGTLKLKVQSVLFPAKNDSCEFEKDNNLSRVDEVVRARREEFVDIPLTGMSRLCNVKFDAPKQNMKFDDEILLTLNQFVIAASQDYSSQSRDLTGKLVYPKGMAIDADGLVSYKWLPPQGLQNLTYFNSKLHKYCIGLDPKGANFETLCQIPKTDTNGSMQLSVPQEAFLKLAIKAGLVIDKQLQIAPKARLGFITTGDNDDSDCRHLDFKMTVTFQYIP